jgi:hypothetical protein
LFLDAANIRTRNTPAGGFKVFYSAAAENGRESAENPAGSYIHEVLTMELLWH